MKQTKLLLILVAMLAFCQTSWTQGLSNLCMTDDFIDQSGNRDDGLPCLPSHGVDENVTAWCGGGEIVLQAIGLTVGTNWVSFYVETDLDALKAALEPIGGSTTDPIIIQANGMQTLYNGTRWRGALSVLDLSQMYKITVPAEYEIELEGVPLDPAELQITIKNGANWIGFPFQQSMTVTEAFAGLPPLNGDVVRTKSGGQATYTNRWRGALTELVPGVGYIYNSASTENRTFTFPTSAK